MTKNNKKGFTIIEVVLVLAIAGLIFLMVFRALPALQRSQRNTRRRQDMARILSAVNDYQANNNGRSPARLANVGGDGNTGVTDVDTDFVTRYVDETCEVIGADPNGSGTVTLVNYSCAGDQFKDPDGSNYNMIYGAHSLVSYWGVEDDSGWGFLRRNDLRENHRIVLAVDAKCSGDESNPLTYKDAGGEASVAIVYVLEGNATYCGDNQ